MIPETTPVPSPSVATPTPPPNYYPLREGARFTYNHRENGVLQGTLIIGFQDIKQNGDQWVARADKTYQLTGNSIAPQTDRVSQSSASIDFAYFQDNGAIYNRFVLPLTVGNKWSFATPDRDHQLTVSDLVDVITPLGTFSKCAHIVEHGDNSLVTTDIDYWLANGIGLVKYRFRQTINGQDAPYIEVVDEILSLR